MPQIILVRHGQASFGTSDYDVLSDLGRRQAELTAATLADRGIRPSRVISGTMRRQRETAEALGAATVEIDPRWNEYDPDEIMGHHGESEIRLEGGNPDGSPLTNKEFHAALEGALAGWIQAAHDSPTPRPFPQFAAAGLAALLDLAAGLGSGESAVVVSSGGTIAATVGALVGAAEANFAALNRVLVNAGITKVAASPTSTNLITFNEHSHLEAAGKELVTYR